MLILNAAQVESRRCWEEAMAGTHSPSISRLGALALIGKALGELASFGPGGPTGPAPSSNTILNGDCDYCWDCLFSSGARPKRRHHMTRTSRWPPTLLNHVTGSGPGGI